MKFLTVVNKNSNFYVKGGNLFHIAKSEPLADVSCAYIAEEVNFALEPSLDVSYFETGVRLRFEEAGEKKVSFFSNDGSLIAYTECGRGRNRDMIDITPTNLGVFVSRFACCEDEEDHMIYSFKQYDGKGVMSHSNFVMLGRYVKYTLEQGGVDCARAENFEEFKKLQNNQEGKEI